MQYFNCEGRIALKICKAYNGNKSGTASRVNASNLWLQKISIPLPRKGLEIPEGWGTGGGGGSRVQGIPEVRGGVSLIYLFFPGVVP